MPSQKTLDRFQDERDAAARPELREGFKADAGKVSFTYLPFDALGAINKVLIFGAKKYAARNWEKGMNWTRPWDACLRHLEAWMRREDSDPETGMSHLWHAGCCILFLIAFEIRGIGTDDRPLAPPTDPVRTQESDHVAKAA